MNSRKLRIAWSVAWGVICLLLIALYVRSYWHHDSIWRAISKNEILLAASGSGSFYIQYANLAAERDTAGWQYQHKPLSSAFKGFNWSSSPAYLLVGTPLWLPLILCITAAAIPWYYWRFSLRAMLIAATLISIGLGLIVMMLRGS
jgi:hypothetical protein